MQKFIIENRIAFENHSQMPCTSFHFGRNVNSAFLNPMKKVFLFASFVFVLAACAPNQSETNIQSNSEPIGQSMSKTDDMKMDDTHMGCQEGEMENGVCTVAKEGNTNRELFADIDELPVTSEMVDYYDGIMGFLAQPQEGGTYPGVVMIHEWWGLNENIKDMAKLLANEGYIVLAVDIYNGEVATESADAMRLAGAAREDEDGSVANMQAAVDYLQGLSNVPNDKIASMGWCFGGQQSLNLALAEDDLAATVIYYGNVIDDTERLSSINWPVLGIFGADDTSISVESVEAFESALNEGDVPNEITIYDGVGHAFANPSGSRYAPEETLDAWNKTVSFLNETTKSTE